MKKQLLRTVNALLRPAGVRLVKAGSDVFDMSAAVARIPTHGLPVRSVIDIGASDGRWSVDAMRTFPNAAFLALEPLQERAAALAQLKAARPNFDYAICAAGDQDGVDVPLTIPGALDSSLIGGAGGATRPVPLRTLDSLASEKQLQPPFLLKFDTHGFEMPILQGARATLAQTSVIIMEVYTFDMTATTRLFPEMCAHLQTLGFRCYDIADPLLRDHDRALWQMDLFFCRSDAPLFTHPTYT